MDGAFYDIHSQSRSIIAFGDIGIMLERLTVSSCIGVALKLTLRLIRYSGIDMFQYLNEEVPPVEAGPLARFALYDYANTISFTTLTFTLICVKLKHRRKLMKL